MARIPDSVQRHIEKHWDSRTVPSAYRADWQRLLADQPWIMLVTGRRLPACNREGHALLFSVDTLKDMGDALAVKAILHEIAHVVLYAQGDADHLCNENRPGNFIYQAAETGVDRLLLSWGVDQSDLLEWSRRIACD